MRRRGVGMGGMGGYTLGDRYVTPDRRLSQMLMQQGSKGGPSNSWQETLGRIAQQLSGAYIGKLDQDNQDVANRAFTRVQPTTYRQPTEEEAYKESPALRNLQALGQEKEIPGFDLLHELPPQPQPSDFSSQMVDDPNDSYSQEQFEKDFPQEEGPIEEPPRVGPRDYAQELAQGMRAYQGNEDNRITKQKMPQLDYSMQNLRGLENNPYAQRLLQGLMMQSADRDYAAGLAKTQRGYDQEDATLKHTRGVETKQLPFTNEQMEQQKKIYDYKQKPRTVTTAEGVFIQNPDGSLGDRIGSPHSQYFDPKQYEQKEKIKADVKGDAYSKKPMPASALKVQDDHIAAINTSKGLDADLGKWDEMITSGKLDLGFFANPINAAKTYTGFGGDEQSRNYSSFKTSLEKMRNESLRLNKGIQTEGDAQRIWNELISNINDEEFVSQRLKELQKTNQRAVEIRKYQIDSIRNNYGKGPLDEAPEPKAIPGGGKTDFVYIPGQGVVPEKRGQK